MNDAPTLPVSTAATLVDSARTLPDPRPRRDGRTTQPTRTTVLPRLTDENGAHRLVLEERARFEELHVLGRGGVGEVVLAVDHDIARRVALKRLLPEAEGDGAVARFADEVRALGALDHPNIVPIHDVGVTPEGKHFYVMKYIQGETLEHVIDRLAEGDAEYHARYTFARRMEVFTAVLRAVQYAHAQGYVHRDLKPANIMVGAYGEVVVMDWGLARRLRDAPESLAAGPSPSVQPGSPRARTLDGSLLGTPAYMSPEQSRGELHLVDEVSDVYALGVIFHELLSLRHYLHAHSSVTATLLAVDRVDPDLAAHETIRAAAAGARGVRALHQALHGQGPQPALSLHHRGARPARTDPQRDLPRGVSGDLHEAHDPRARARHRPPPRGRDVRAPGRARPRARRPRHHPRDRRGAVGVSA
jgi:serine/threonine protein kinase